MVRSQIYDLAKKKSPADWLGDFLPLDYDEAIIYGPVVKKDAEAYGEHITHAFSGRVSDIKVYLRLYQGKCIAVDVIIQSPFFMNNLRFLNLPPLSASEIIKVIWTAITSAMTRPNVDPVALARESLLHGPLKSKCPEEFESFSIFPAAQE